MERDCVELQLAAGRVGQGQRCAYLRLVRYAELHLPIESKVLVEPGQVLVAGSDLIGKVPHP